MISFNSYVSFNGGVGISDARTSTTIKKSNDSKDFSEIVDNQSYYSSEKKSNDVGFFEDIGDITFGQTNINNIIFLFDLDKNEYPRTIYLNEKIYTEENESPVLFIKLDSSKTKNVVSFQNWNKPNRPLVIMGIMSGFDISSNKLISFSFTGQDRNDKNLPSFGIRTNDGKCDIIDKYEILKKANQQKVLKKAPIYFYLNNKSRKERIGSFIIDEIDFDERTNKTNIIFYDGLIDFQDKNVPFQLKFVGNKTSVLDIVYLLFSGRTIMFYGETYDYLSKIKNTYSYFGNGDFSLWSALTKICEATGCYIYADEMGDIVIKYGRGS